MKRYSWFLGVVAFLLLVVVTLNGVSTSQEEEVSSGGPKAGAKLYPFATPLATSDLKGDANIATKDGQGEFGARAACTVRGPKILNVCELYERGPLVLAIFSAEGGPCREVLDQFQRLAPQFPKVSFAGVGSLGDRKDLKGSWRFPVGWDRDGAVASRYGLVDCPQITFALKGGKVLKTTRGDLADEEIVRLVRKLR